MLNRIQTTGSFNNLSAVSNRQKNESVQNNATNVVSFNGSKEAKVGADKLALALRGYNGIKLASSVSFTGSGSVASIFSKFNKTMYTCKDEAHGKEGEEVGKRFDINNLLAEFIDELPQYDDAIKTTGVASQEKDEFGNVTFVTDTRKQVKRKSNDNYKFELVVRPPRHAEETPHRTNHVQQVLNFEIEPPKITYDDKHERIIKGTPENVYALNTKGKFMAIVEDGEDVILTNTGYIEKKDSSNGALKIDASQYELKDKKGGKLSTRELANMNSIEAVRTGKDKEVVHLKNTFKPFEVTDVPVVAPKTGGSLGGGTELVIGLEDGRFVPEIIDSIATFCDKVQKGEIVLDEFVPAKDAQNIQVAMLAGGFGSRAEYTNASSSKILHGKQDGSNLTKGCFRTATGLTPMETTFVSLHKAGLLDCSKENLGIGKNIKFYLNDSGKNGGNGGFTVDLYDTMEKDDRKSLVILPNDAMSRIPNALSEMTEIMNSGKAAMVMVAKEVDKEDARGSLGIMKINDEGEIEAFAEKPKTFEEGYVDENDKCFANTFQFTVSKEAFDALKTLNDGLMSEDSGKEPRDWSKTYTPILMALTQNDDPEEMQNQIRKTTGRYIPVAYLQNAKKCLGDQKIYAVKTSEPWADCGTMNALYHTTMEIASGAFPLEDFERKHVCDSVDTKTGLVASSPEQKEAIQKKYDIKGQVMAVPKAKAVSESIISDYADAVVRYSDKAPKK